MKNTHLIIGCLCIFALAVMPAQAFTINSLTITLETNGDAYVDINYHLSFLEHAAVFLKMADPAGELQHALENNLGKPVSVLTANDSHADIIITNFANVGNDQSVTTMATPPMSFVHAQQVMNQYWFAPLVSPDFSPSITTIAFPDNYQAIYYDQISIPSVAHVLA